MTDPPAERYDLVGRRLCRWCPQVLSCVQYISVKTKHRLEQFTCSVCDSPDKPGVLEAELSSWKTHSFGYTPGPDHPQGY